MKTTNSMTTVILATLNEEKGIGPTLRELQEILPDSHYIVIDGNSVDRTVEIAKELGAKIVMQKGKGKGDAIAQVLGQVNSDTRYVVFIDADYTYPTEYLPQMIELLDGNPEIGMVTGNRFNSHFILSKAMNDTFYLGNRFLAFTQYILNGVKMSDPLTGLRVVRWELLQRWSPKSKGFDVEAELNHFVERNGYLISEIPIHYRKRLGAKKLRLRHGFLILKRILTESLS